MLQRPIVPPMDSANARDCLLHLAKTKLSEREDLVQLNDKFIDIIEHVHYMEAEHAALEHDYNLLKSGVQSDSSGINEIFELEIRNVRVGVEDANRNRQQLLTEQNNLSQQVKQVEQQWRHLAQSALGVPKEVDDDFNRISQIEAENSLTLRRIKYIEDKNRLIKQNNGRIYEQINLMRMRKDQAVSLHQEYLLRKNELLNSIRNLEEDNKRIIMNEHKYFVRDRSVDRHTFRDQLRQAIADIRADYEFKRLKNEEEIRVRTESEIRRIQASTGGNITRDRLKEELLIVKSNCNGLQQQVSSTEIRNATLTQQIEVLRLELSENHQTFEISLDFKIKEIEKLREQCTSISLELEKLCDLNIDLQKEIAKYRELLDRSGNVNVRTTNGNIKLEGSLNRFTSSTTSSSQHQAYVAPAPVSYPVIETPASTTYSRRETFQVRDVSPAPAPYVPPVAPVIIPSPVIAPIRVSPLPAASSTIEYTRRDIQTGSISRDHSPLPARSPIPAYVPHQYRPYEVPPTDVSVTSHQYKGYHESSNSTSTVVTGTDFHHHSPPVQHSPQLETVRETGSIRSWTPTTPGLHGVRPIGTGVTSTGVTSSHVIGTGAYSGGIGSGVHQQTVVSAHQSSTSQHGTSGRYESAAIGTGVSGTGRGSLYDSASKTSGRSERRQTTIFNPDATITTTTAVGGNFEYSSDVDSVDEENFQRFTRWYKGRVKISDVTPEFIQLVNRSSKKRVDIGGFKIIHEYGHNSVYVDLPAGLILGPKESLKIYARSAPHEPRSVVAEIDLFDTTVHTNTSIRNMNNEVKAWFVYTSNTEIGDHHH